ncbi:hypothetical protein BB559_005269 [Furculomyces boomerangus]|uniref:DUF7721 domain-containing protein n=1 Tax=Furculomyces boomerangus TaxID=61424 RepID=A0A2T9Y9K0_9FUNG|nr:hypothetical protein BB559_005269 [Furculomyces boomerangus]
MDFGKLASMAEGGNNNQNKQGGFDVSNLASMASGFMGGSSQGQNNNNQGENNQNKQGGLDVSNLASMASGFMGGSSQGQNQGQSQNLLQTAMSLVGNASGSAPKTSEIQDAHNQAYGLGNLGQMSQQAMGMAAAYQVFQKFGGGNGGNSQGDFISMIIKEAMKLFTGSGGNSQGGNTNQLLMSAAQTGMKLFNK